MATDKNSPNLSHMLLSSLFPPPEQPRNSKLAYACRLSLLLAAAVLLLAPLLMMAVGDGGRRDDISIFNMGENISLAS